EAFDVAILTWAAALDISGLCTDSGNPVLHGLGDKLWAVVGADIPGDAAQDERIRQDIYHVDRLELAGDPDRQIHRAPLFPIQIRSLRFSMQAALNSMLFGITSLDIARVAMLTRRYRAYSFGDRWLTTPVQTAMAVTFRPASGKTARWLTRARPSARTG